MKLPQIHLSSSPADTFAFGQRLAASLRGGDVIALFGDLGAGKTALVQGIAAGLGIKTKVNSPTFTIMKLYTLRRDKVKQFCHIDAYRLRDARDLVAIGAGDYLGTTDTISAVEWAEKTADLLPPDCWRITLKLIGPEEREIVVA